MSEAVSDTPADPTPVRVLPRPPGFTTDLVYVENPEGSQFPLRLIQHLDFDDGFLSFTIKAPFDWDGASIPRWFKGFLPPKLFIYASVPHDKAARTLYDRRVSDALFHMVARTNEQAGWFRARIALRGLQLFGWTAWRSWKHRNAAQRAEDAEQELQDAENLVAQERAKDDALDVAEDIVAADAAEKEG